MPPADTRGRGSCRSESVTVGLVLLLSLAAAAGAETNRPSDEAFFPMDPAYTWVYDTRHRTKDERFDMTVRVEGAWKDGSLGGLILTQEDPRGRMREYLVRVERGWGMAKVAIKRSIAPEVSTRFEPPMPRMMFPVEPGSKLHWEGQLQIGWIDKKIVFDGEVVGWENVTVPAGTFRCVRLHFVEKRGNEHVEEDVWYAPGVGQVKYSGSNYIKELKSLKKP